MPYRLFPIRDRPFNLKGGGGVMVFFLTQKIFFARNENQKIFFRKSLKQKIFFSQDRKQKIFFLTFWKVKSKKKPTYSKCLSLPQNEHGNPNVRCHGLLGDNKLKKKCCKMEKAHFLVKRRFIWSVFIICRTSQA